MVGVCREVGVTGIRVADWSDADVAIDGCCGGNGTASCSCLGADCKGGCSIGCGVRGWDITSGDGGGTGGIGGGGAGTEERNVLFFCFILGFTGCCGASFSLSDELRSFLILLCMLQAHTNTQNTRHQYNMIARFYCFEA